MARAKKPNGDDRPDAGDDDGGGDTVVTVKDYKRGKAADGHKVPVGGTGDDASPPKDHNFAYSGETIDEYLAKCAETEKQIEALDDKIRVKTEPERTKKAELRKKLKDAKAVLVGDGYHSSILDVMAGEQRDRRHAEKRKEQLDPELQARLKKAKEAWEDWRGLPLGAASDAREPATAH